jgi:hypothetical protein
MQAMTRVLLTFSYEYAAVAVIFTNNKWRLWVLFAEYHWYQACVLYLTP